MLTGDRASEVEREPDDLPERVLGPLPAALDRRVEEDRGMQVAVTAVPGHRDLDAEPVADLADRADQLRQGADGYADVLVETAAVGLHRCIEGSSPLQQRVGPSSSASAS